MTDPQVIVNLGTGGSDLNGQNGSTSSADSNDARFLDWPGDNAGNYVYLPGVASNSMSVPDEAALDITGDIDLRAYISLDSWTPSVVQRIINKDDGASNRSYFFRVETDGKLRLFVDDDGTSTGLTNTSTVATGFADGSSHWIRGTFDLDNGSGNSEMKFFTSEDGATWTQLGTTITGSVLSGIYSGSANAFVGSGNNGFEPMAGKFYRAQVLDGIDGTTVLDVDTSIITSGSATSFTDLTGNHTVTINRSTSGRKSVAVVSPVWLFGTDDYMEVADNALLDFGASDSFTLLAIVRQWSTPSNFSGYIGKMDSGLGYIVLSNATNLQGRTQIGDGTTSVARNGSSFSSGDLVMIGSQADRTLQKLFAITDSSFDAGGNISAVGTLANGSDLFVGSTGTASQDFELLGVAIFRRVLTASELAAITTYYQNKAA